jgi:hypothetical protein
MSSITNQPIAQISLFILFVAMCPTPSFAAPSLTDLDAEVLRNYAWLADLTEQEAMFARADARDRGAIIEAVRNMPRSAIPDDANLY